MNNNKKAIIPSIHKPPHLYTHTELIELCAHLKSTGNKAGLELMQPELDLREEEAKIIKNQTWPEVEKPKRQYDNSFRTNNR